MPKRIEKLSLTYINLRNFGHIYGPFGPSTKKIRIFENNLYGEFLFLTSLLHYAKNQKLKTKTS